MTTAKQEYNKFFKMIGLAHASDIQRQEMQRAFFAGQFSMFMFQLGEVAALDDDAAERALAARQAELESYFKANFQQRN